MGNYKWNINDSDTSLPYVVVFLTSRNKDNVEVPNFKQRKRAYFMTQDIEKIAQKFDDFVNAGVPGEMCRCYVSVNARDPKKVKKALLLLLIEKDEINFDYLEPVVAGIAAKRENALEKKWMFDFDDDSIEDLKEFVADIRAIDPTVNPMPLPSPHGFSVIVEHGFDTRELLAKWTNVSLKRDDLFCYLWRNTSKN